jgi:hypothetical protein
LISTRSMPAWLVLEVRLGKAPGTSRDSRPFAAFVT